jgi:tetratricopeptide (TPR) repeat protein
MSDLKVNVGMEISNLNVAISFARLGELDQAWSFAELGALSASRKEPALYYGFRFVLAEVLRMRGRIDEAREYLESLGSPDENCIDLVVAWKMHLGYCLGLLGRYGECNQLLELARCSTIDANLTELHCEVLLRQGMIHYVRREFANSDRSYRDALNLCKALKSDEGGDWYLESTALAGVGKNLMIQDHFAEAIPWFEKSLAISEKAHARYSAARLWNELAMCHLGLGDSAKALALLREAERVTWEIQAVPAYQVCLADIGNVFFHRGDYVQAMSYYTRALTFAHQIKDPVSVTKWTHNMNLAYQKMMERLKIEGTKPAAADAGR